MKNRSVNMNMPVKGDTKVRLLSRICVNGKCPSKIQEVAAKGSSVVRYMARKGGKLIYDRQLNADEVGRDL